MRRLGRWIKRLSIVAIALFAAAMVFYIWLLPAIVHRRIIAALADAGLPSAKLDVRAVSLDSIDLANVRLSPPESPESPASPDSPNSPAQQKNPAATQPTSRAGFSIANLRARYHWRSLWRDRRIDSVELTGVNWRIVTTPRGIDWGLPTLGSQSPASSSTPGNPGTAPLPRIDLRASTIELVAGDMSQRIPVEGTLRPPIPGISDAWTCDLRIDAPMCPIVMNAIVAPPRDNRPAAAPATVATTAQPKQRQVEATIHLLNLGTRIAVTGRLDDQGGADIKAYVVDNSIASSAPDASTTRAAPTLRIATSQPAEPPDFRARFVREIDGQWALWTNGRLRVAGLDITGRVSANPQEAQVVVNAIELGQNLMQAKEMAALDARLPMSLHEGTHVASLYWRFKRPPGWMQSLLATQGITIQSLDGCTLTSKLEATWKDGWRVTMPATRVEIEGLSASWDRRPELPCVKIDQLSTTVDCKGQADEKGFTAEIVGPVTALADGTSVLMEGDDSEPSLSLSAWTIEAALHSRLPLLAWRGNWKDRKVEQACSFKIISKSLPSVKFRAAGFGGTASAVELRSQGHCDFSESSNIYASLSFRDAMLSHDSDDPRISPFRLKADAKWMMFAAMVPISGKGISQQIMPSLADMVPSNRALDGFRAAMSHCDYAQFGFTQGHLETDDITGTSLKANGDLNVSARGRTDSGPGGATLINLSGSAAYSTPDGKTTTVAVESATADLFRRPRQGPENNPVKTGAAADEMWLDFRAVRPTVRQTKGVATAEPSVAVSAQQAGFTATLDAETWTPRSGMLRVGDASGYDNASGIEVSGVWIKTPMTLAALSTTTQPAIPSIDGELRITHASLGGAALTNLRGRADVHAGVARLAMVPIAIDQVLGIAAALASPQAAGVTPLAHSPVRIQATQPDRPAPRAYNELSAGGPPDWSELRQSKLPPWLEPPPLAVTQPATQPSPAVHIAGELNLLAPTLTGQITASAKNIDLRRLTPIAQDIPMLQGLSFDGRASVSADVRFEHGALKPEIVVNVVDAAVRDPVTGSAIEGLSTRLTIDGLTPMSTPSHQAIAIKSVELGEFKLSDGRIGFRLEPDGTVFIEDMRWGLPEGGTVRTSAVRIVPTGSTADVATTQPADRTRADGPVQRIDAELLFDDLSLKSWLSLLSADHLTGDGKLYGRLPISLRPGAADKIRFGEGFLYATPSGGFVKVNSPKAVDELLSKPESAGAAIVQQVQKRALEAIYDFQFNMLRFDFVREEGKGLLCRIQTAGKGRTGETPQEIGSLTVNIADFDRYLSGAIMAKMQLGSLGETMKRIMERREQFRNDDDKK